ncbi:MAG: CBS and ACT domain-containing protein [Anaerolineae bacterium]|nr:CBS and ACT domain-containing protein [Anaerolineae bacterium]MDW8101587.1 CBS and ACT domain-containing protein [Anaerolineae bacterium]
MLVRDRMSRHPITIRPDVTIHEALQIMRREKIRRLPVLDENDRLVGIVAEKDLLYASPSSAKALNVYELQYLLAKLTVGDVMTRNVITVTEFTPLEEAARIMVDNKIGALPVMRGEQLVGIITETDIFKVFLELLGARERGLRLTLLVPEAKGVLASLTGTIAELGGNIIALGTFKGEDPTNRIVTIKVEDVNKDKLLNAIRSQILEVLDVREL